MRKVEYIHTLTADLDYLRSRKLNTKPCTQPTFILRACVLRNAAVEATVLAASLIKYNIERLEA